MAPPVTTRSASCGWHGRAAANRSTPATTRTLICPSVSRAGAGALSNEIDLVAVAPPPPQSPCTVPGVTILTDKSGDTSAVLGIVNTPAPAGSDLLSFQLAQPYQTDNIPRLVFTINAD